MINPFIASASIVLNSALSTPIESALAIRVEGTSLLYVGFSGMLRGVSRYCTLFSGRTLLCTVVQRDEV